jgi:hypothetical protein
MLWYSRPIRFSDALLGRDLAGTNIRHHPGVTVMWLSGNGLQLFARWRGLTTRHLRGLEPTQRGVTDDAVVAGVLPLALANAPFADPGVLDSHTATWDWGDGSTSPGTVSKSDGSGTVLAPVPTPPPASAISS